MPYYVVPAITEITDEDAIHRPDVPGGHTWGGERCGDSYLALVYPPIPGVQPLDRDGLEAECEARELEMERVLAWLLTGHGGEEVLR